MTAAHKKHTKSDLAHAKSDLAHARKKVTPEKKPESVPDVVQPEVPQPANVVEPAKEVPVNPQPLHPAESVAPTASAVMPAASSDPLTDFKEKMTEEESFSNVPAKKNFMWPILFVVFLALASMAGIFIYKQGMNKGTEVNVVTLTPTPTIIPIPTVAKVDLSKYEIKILNGSETEGEAGKQKSNLESKGFTVSSIGNAQNSDYTKTIIQAKENVDRDFLDKLKSVLEESFVVGEIEELPDDSTASVILIIGTKK